MKAAAWLGWGVALCVGVSFGTYLWLGRPLDPSLKLGNNSGAALDDVQMTFHFDGTNSKKNVSRIQPGSSVVVKVPAGDLYLDSIAFTLKGKKFTIEHPSIATPTECYAVYVQPDGSIQGGYE